MRILGASVMGFPAETVWLLLGGIAAILGWLAIWRRRKVQAPGVGGEAWRQPDDGGDSGAWEWDVPTSTVRIAPAWRRLFGQDAALAEISRRQWLMLVHAEDRPRVQEAAHAHFQGSVSRYDCEYRVVGVDGRRRWIRDRGRATLDGEGRPMRIAGFSTDVTIAKRSEAISRLILDLVDRCQRNLPLEHVTAALCRDGVATLDLESVWVGVKRNDPRLKIIAGADAAGDWLAEEAETRAALVPAPLVAQALATGCTQIGGRGTGQSVSGQESFTPRQVAVVPIADGPIRGVMVCQTAAANSFEPRFLVLLEGIARSLSLALSLSRAREQLALQDIALDAAANGVVITNESGIIEWVNRGFEQITGYLSAEVVGRTPAVFRSGMHDKSFYADLWARLRRGEVYRGDFVNRRKDGATVQVANVITPVRGADGQINRFVAIQEDITERKQAQTSLLYMAHHDVLTDLANRANFSERVAQAIASAQRTGRGFAVMLIDLDHFKHLNEERGHAVGDAFLRAVARRLACYVRANDVLARLGGDEFVILQSEVRDYRDSEAFAERLLETLAVPVELEGEEIYTSGSIGITLYPGDGNSVEELLKHADIAMYRAKQEGRNSFRFFSLAMHETVVVRADLARALRFAIERDELRLHYQPQIDLRTGDLVGVEALVRWQHPEKGLLAPGAFIGLAEDTGLIRPLGDWVLDHACIQIKEWQRNGLGRLRLGVNLSFAQFQDDLVGNIRATLERHALDPDSLELELTESVLAQDIERTMRTIEGLGQLGVHLAIDDFGTGYSSLAYLRRFRLNRLKIDKSFIADLGSAEGAMAIVSAAIGLAHSLGLTVVAEGVETQYQIELLRAHGCDEAQGYYISRPLAPDAFERFAGQHRGRSEPALIAVAL